MFYSHKSCPLLKHELLEGGGRWLLELHLMPLHVVHVPSLPTLWRMDHCPSPMHLAMPFSNQPFSCTFYLSGVCQALTIQSKMRRSCLFSLPTKQIRRSAIGGEVDGQTHHTSQCNDERARRGSYRLPGVQDQQKEPNHFG